MEVSGLSAKRTIIHLDLDAFYAQVEMKRKQVPEDTPLAVQQWDGLIAVNYPARARGVTRHMRTAQALEACPDLMLVHVQTIGSGGVSAANEEGSADACGNTKACLQRYRAASGCIMRVLKGQLTHGAQMEKAGLDEVFLDVTPMVDAELRRMQTGGHPGQPTAGGSSGSSSNPHAGTSGPPAASSSHQPETPASATPATANGQSHAGHHMAHVQQDSSCPGHGTGQDMGRDGSTGSQMRRALHELVESVEGHTIIEGDVKLDMDLEADQRLAVAAGIAKRLRDAVMQDASCGYTCSAGIGPNKLLSKVGSARNKPNKQTLLLPRAVPGLMQGLAIGKLRGLGGKLGAALQEALGAQTAADVQAASLQDLTRVVGEKAWWLWHYVRGIDDEPVKPKGPIKSLNSCKSFNQTSNLNEISRWMSMLAFELAERMAEDEWEHHRRARNLMLSYRSGRGAMVQERSVRGAMPSYTASTGPSADNIAAAAMAMFRKLQDALPCARLALSATEFFQPPAEGVRAITHFLAPLPSQQPTQQPQPQPKKHPTDGKRTIAHFLARPQPQQSQAQPTTQPTTQPTAQPTTQPANAPGSRGRPAQPDPAQPAVKRPRGVGCFNSGGIAQHLNPSRDQLLQPRPTPQAPAAAASAAPGAARQQTALSRQLHRLLGPARPQQDPEPGGLEPGSGPGGPQQTSQQGGPQQPSQPGGPQQPSQLGGPQQASHPGCHPVEELQPGQHSAGPRLARHLGSQPQQHGTAEQPPPPPLSCAAHQQPSSGNPSLQPATLLESALCAPSHGGACDAQHDGVQLLSVYDYDEEDDEEESPRSGDGGGSTRSLTAMETGGWAAEGGSERAPAGSQAAGVQQPQVQEQHHQLLPQQQQQQQSQPQVQQQHQQLQQPLVPPQQRQQMPHEQHQQMQLQLPPLAPQQQQHQHQLPHEQQVPPQSQRQNETRNGMSHDPQSAFQPQAGSSVHQPVTYMELDCEPEAAPMQPPACPGHESGHGLEQDETQALVSVQGRKGADEGRREGAREGEGREARTEGAREGEGVVDDATQDLIRGIDVEEQRRILDQLKWQGQGSRPAAMAGQGQGSRPPAAMKGTANAQTKKGKQADGKTQPSIAKWFRKA